MTIYEYLESINYPRIKIKVLGEDEKCKYYFEVYDDPDEDVGIPFVVAENKRNNTFEICDEEDTFKVLKSFD